MTLDFAVLEAFRVAAARGAASAIISRHSRAMLQVRRNQVMSQGSSWWPSGGEHMPSLESETGPRAGQVDAIIGTDLAHAAISSLSGSQQGGKSQARARARAGAGAIAKRSP